MLPFYPALAFSGSFLLFVIQPIAGRLLLPVFGGAPAVWMTCLLFFQAALLAGYALAHYAAGRWLRFVFPALLAAGWLLRAAPAAADDPVPGILLYLLRAVGPVTIGLAMLGPLLQRWFRDQTGQEPYRLYAWSNAGSLAALLCYPFLLEPTLRLALQFQLWLVLAGGVFLAVLRAVPASMTAPEPLGAAPTGSLLRWTLLAACGSALLSATTNQITQEVSATPFLWVLPLAIFLVTFILTFESDRWYDERLFSLLASGGVLVACMVMTLGATVPLWARVAVYSIALFAGCMVCFGELVRSRPDASALTTFYLAIAAGGMLGSAFVALLAPRLFVQYTEYPLALIACLGIRFLGWQRDTRLGPARYLVPGLAIGAVLLVLAKDDGFDVLRRSRNFFGTVQVHTGKDDLGFKRVLTHGTIVHGVQYLEAGKRALRTTYYGRLSGVGQVLGHLGPQPARVGVVGLGIGTLAAYGRAGDVYRFYEINPDVIDIARQDFRFLGDSAARVEIVPGDARLMLARERLPFDVLVIDAFSSDAIPAHLLTAEAAALYGRLLRPGGALLLHVSNRALDLAPVGQGVARHLKLPVLRLNQPGVPAEGCYASHWLLISDNEDLRALPGIQKIATPFTRPAITWTDDFSSLWPLLK